MAEIKQHADGSLGIWSESEGISVWQAGGPKVPAANMPTNRGNVLKFILAAGVDTGGGILSWQNTFETAIIILGATLDVITIATGACSLDVGEEGTNGTTAATNLFSAQDVHSAPGIFTGSSGVKVPVGAWVTASTHSGGASAGLVANLYLEYIKE